MKDRRREPPEAGPATGPAAEPERLHKWLARNGVASRRTAERWIAEGRVLVNGERATLGLKVSDADRVLVDNRRIHADRGGGHVRVLIYNKPEGEICTRSDPEGRPTCFERLPPLARGRWIAVGRLDANSSGLLVFSNDGTLVHHLMHPSAGIDREYAIRIDGDMDEAVRTALLEGVLLEDGPARFTDLRHYGGSGRNQWYHGVVMEGRNREVRRLMDAVGLTVSRLKRVRYGPVILPSTLRRGMWAEIDAVDVLRLFAMLGLPPPAHAGPPPARTPPGGSRRPRTLTDLLIAYPGLPER